MKPPQIAFLILAHASPAALARMTRALRAPNTRCFVHLDRSVARAPFDQAVADNPDVVMLDDADRFVVNWGGFRIVEATLRLIARAKADVPQVTRFCLLSGADYPARPMDEIIQALASDTEFMKINRRLEWGGPLLHDGNITHPFFGDFAPANPRSGLPWVAKVADRLSRASRLPKLAKVDFYHGSCWWALSAGAIDAMLAQLAAQPDLLQRARRIKIPDEILFHTLIKMTPFADQLSQDGAANPDAQEPDNLHGSHYIRWTDPNPVLPRTLLAGDLEGIRASGALFARKMDNDRSADLLTAIDDMRQLH